MSFKNILKGVKDNSSDLGDPGTCVPLDEFDSISKEAMLEIRAKVRSRGFSEEDIDHCYPLPTD